METTTARNSLKITINPNPGTEVNVQQWEINSTNHVLEIEPERVDIERNGKVYSILFTDDSVVVEVWDNELNEFITTTSLPN